MKYVRLVIFVIMFISSVFIINGCNSNKNTAKELPEDFILDDKYHNDDANISVYVDYPKIQLFKLNGYTKNGYYFDRTDIYKFDILKYDETNIYLYNGEHIISHGMISRTETIGLSGEIIINLDGSIYFNINNEKTISHVPLVNK